MSDEDGGGSRDRFAQLSEADQKGDEQSPKKDTSSQEQTTANTATEEGSDGEDGTEPVDPAETPAFEFDDNLRRSMYFRDETWSEFKKGYNMNGIPRLYELGIDPDDLTEREIHDAIVRTAKDNPEEVAEKIAEDRGIEVETN